ncbi:Pleckstrin homology and lipid-binding START domains-containing protein [Perilla frutescens var. hirtella]|uniref:Pleckstrin homology and lipid-binding START domains-containing protein n=1 Tax=Perilla frutescens var. hirtella TaxID=608512 RepID=A0AAD4PF05_PERFH|nr:Pleckstrin homology and lipid-binding START domains-containing protein [Perilla frutescens var. hirtella]KAH6810389.1 Pleckstrin homology and lipid-binding START domains-containing protein [Perilla frutescens var. frutescens]KAH6836502.1 Pleckstrin homology and lipid-binding START domains-containing protein [Perilla frutescens var. hirtella]
MAVPQNDGGRMEGWLYLIRSNRIGLQYSRKRYFVLQDHLLKSFKSVPLSTVEDPVRSAIIDSCIRVTDNGRESMHRKVLFIFTLYNTSNHNDQLKLGANSPEDAAKWIQSFQESALKPNQNQGEFELSRREPQSLRLNCSSKHSYSIDWTVYSSSVSDAMTSDVVAPSPWKIFGCQNGLRLFKEAKEKESHRKWDDHPAIMAVGVVDATSEAIFQTLMSLGPSRSEWDFCLHKGSVIEHIDGHTDIVHKLLYHHWLPWGMKRRDLLLRRYWRREDDGTYVILYHSVFHLKCPPKRGYVRACLKSGGYVISPVNQGRRSVVKHMLAIDWKFWKSYLWTSSARSITISMMGRLAALRELFRAKLDSSSSDFSSGELMSNSNVQQKKMDLKVDVQNGAENGQNREDMEEEVVKTPSEHSNLVGLNDATDEFFDVPEPLDYDQSETGWPSDYGLEMYSQDARQPKMSTAAVFVKKLHDLAVQKKGYVDLHDMAREDSLSCKYGYTLPKDPTCNLLCSWTATDPSTFLIRGKTYLDDRKKIKAKGTLMEMVGADWLRSDKREDDLGGRPGGIVQKYAAKGGPEFFFIVNIQVPGSTTYNLALYYMMSTPLEEAPLLESFVKGDDGYRNSRFKLIPYISKGSWIVKQSVGKKACLVGQALEINYFRGKNYIELGVDIGSSTVARGVVNLVLGYLNNLVIEMAFLVQANTPEELPEYLIGTCRLNHLDVSKSVLVKP